MNKITRIRPKRISKRGRINEGRPPLFEDPELMANGIEAYFARCDSCMAEKIDSDGRVTRYSNPAPYTFSGLAYFLGFTDSDRLLEYEKRPEYAGIVSRARLKVESWWESRLATNANNGAIFWLKNRPKAPWREKIEVEESAEIPTLGQILDRLNGKHASQKLTAIDCVTEHQGGEYR